MSTRLAWAILTISISAPAQSGLPIPATGNVTLPLGEYNRLVEQAAKPPKPPDAPPFPHIVKNVQMNLQVAGESVTGTIVLEGEVFAKGEHKVPLVAGMIVLDARRSGQDLPVDGGAAVLSGPAEFEVTVEAGLPLTIEPGRASFTLPAPAAGTVRLTLSVPGDQTQVNLNPGLITSRASRDGRTTIEAALVPGKPAQIWWAARLSAPTPPVAPKEVRFVSDIKTLISVSDAELGMAALAEVSVVQGEPTQFEVLAPEGYELTGATGPTLISSDVQARIIRLTVGASSTQGHQFLISLARANSGTKAEVPLVSFRGAQRETGEVLVEGEGAMELTASETGGLRRMDLKETSPMLRSLARASLHAAFRYQRKPAETPAVTLAWVRFPDSSVLSAVAQRAEVTTLVTSEGRSLTEVKLTVKNQAQPFLKVALPAGASILSCEVAGEKVKPVTGADGSRVPLLRPGFRPSDSYGVSFVFVHAGAPFEKKGGAELALPKMDVPVGLVEWEVFLPQRYRVADFGGDAIAAHLLPAGVESERVPVSVSALGISDAAQVPSNINLDAMGPGQVGGIVTDPTGAVVPGVNVEVLHIATGAVQRTYTDGSGRWLVANVPSGRLRVTASAMGFRATAREIDHDAGRGLRFSLMLQIGAVTETVEVTANSAQVRRESQQVERNARQNAAAKDTEASANVTDLQRRVAGVLPIGMSVPRAGNSYRFARPLVVDEETRLTFSYRSK